MKFSKRMDRLEKNIQLEVREIVEKLIKQGRKIYDFSITTSDFKIPPCLSARHPFRTYVIVN